MTLQDLMDNAFDETWFCVVTPDGEEHMFWNADYLGSYDETMEELEPLLEREFEDFDVVTRNDPESPRRKVPMVRVPLLKTEEELELDRIEAMKGEGI